MTQVERRHAAYTSPFIPLNVNYFHESKHGTSTCNKSAGGEASSVARCCLAMLLTGLLEQSTMV